MKKRVLILSLVLLIPAALFSATTGKIIGAVVDQETGEPLPGANVIIEGTTLGAATNAQGGYIILNVPPGDYTVRASFIGYEPVQVSSVQVSVGLTTELNFDLPAETIEVESISIVAERPLINKSSTNETHIMTAEDIQNMPLRSLAGAVATNTGVVTARGDMYVRGGRTGEVAYYVDGIYSNDLRTGARVGTVPITSLEQVNYQAGGFNAEYGFANSGIVIASTRSGSNDFNMTAEVITDQFLSQENQTLGTYSYGYSVYNLTVSGPIGTDKLSYFASGEYTWNRDQQPSAGTHPVVDGDFGREDIMLTSSELHDLGVPDEEGLLPVRNVEGPLPNNWMKEWSFNGNLQYAPNNNLRIKVGGNGTMSEDQDYSITRSLVNQGRVQLDERFNYSVFGKLTHTINPKTFYDFTGYYSAFGSEFSDPVYGRQLANYTDKTDWNGDGVSNPFLVQNGSLIPAPFRLGSGMFQAPNNPYPYYTLNRSNVLGLKLDFTSVIMDNHELKAGFEYRYNTIRRYDTQPWRLSGPFANNPDVDPANVYRTAYTDNFGYPLYFPDHEVDPSNTSDEGLDGAKNPIIASVYLQDKIELSDLVLNIGLRGDYLNTNAQRPEDYFDIKIKNDAVDPASLVDTEPHFEISPRLGLSFPVTDRTVFHAQYGKFIQQPELQYLYTGWTVYAANMTQGNQVEVNNPDLKPTQTISYEIGVGQQLGNNSSLSITAYYKEITDNIVLRNRVGAKPRVYAQFQNGDYGNVKGLSFTYKLRPTNGLSANVNYTLQYAQGTGSTSSNNFYITWIGNDYYPVFIYPLDFDQRHTLSVNLDYRRNNWGVNVLAQAGSGFPYTPKRIADTVFGATYQTAFPVAGTNSAYTNWTSNINLRVDRSFKLAGVDMNVYLWVLNLLGTKQPFNRKNDLQSYGSGIYEATGRPDDNGWLATDEGQKWIEANNGIRAEELYRARTNMPDNWDSPRQIRLGLRFGI